MSGDLRIAMLTYGSRGDVEPFIALGVGLRSAGHSVRLAAPASFGPFIAAYDLAFEPIEGNPGELTEALADRAGLSWPRMVARMIEHVVPLAEDVFRGVEKAAEGADLIVHSFLMTDAGHTLARSMGVPDLSAQFFPVFLPTTAFAAAALPDLPLGPLYRRATHSLTTAVFRYGSRLLYGGIRALGSDLPDLAPWPFRRTKGDTTPILFAYSPHILPKPPSWPSWAHVTGYWELPLPVGWRPPEALRRFLKAGPAPIYFGPGSVRSEHMERLLRNVVAACRAQGQRVVLGVPPESLEGDLESGDVFYADEIPHRWLFPRMRFILHHGGAGTTGAAARAGVPSTAIPLSVDQAFWARRICKLGLGPAAPPARRVGRSCLERILQDALTTPAYGRRAGELREKLSQEDGVSAAREVVESLLATG
jgi:sterol 3beta-glucosyltransferase